MKAMFDDMGKVLTQFLEAMRLWKKVWIKH